MCRGLVISVIFCSLFLVFAVKITNILMLTVTECLRVFLTETKSFSIENTSLLCENL